MCPLDDRDNPRRPLTPRERRLLLVALALVGVMVALARYGLPLP